MNAQAKIGGDRQAASARSQRGEPLSDAGDERTTGRFPRAGITAAFGLWGKDGLDGLAYQDWVRGE